MEKDISIIKLNISNCHQKAFLWRMSLKMLKINLLIL